MGLKRDDLLARLTSAYTDRADSNIAKFFQAVYNGCWVTIERGIADLQAQRYVSTMTGAVLDKWARVVKLTRKAGESDAQFRLRVIGAIRRLRGGATPDDLLAFTETLLNASPGDVKLFENKDSQGAYRDAYVRVEVPAELLARLGFATSEYATVIANIETILDRVAGGGVKTEVLLAGGAVWDTDAYDDGVYGS
jgi:hypothetical protein